MNKTTRTSLLLLASLSMGPLAFAQEEVDESEAALAPGIPAIQSLPGGVTPAFGRQSESDTDWRFGFHGILSLPLRYGINQREDVQPGQSKTVFHAPPRTPDEGNSFSFVGVQPQPYVQMNFSSGNSIVTGNIIMKATSLTSADSFFNPPDHVTISDAFVQLNPLSLGKTYVTLRVGAFTERYGAMGEYDEGRYGTPLIARLEGGGYTGGLTAPLSEKFTLVATQGLMGQMANPTFDLSPGQDDNADPLVGSSFAHHLSLGLRYNRWLQTTGYFLQGLSRDDRATPTGEPDGTLTVIGADVRASTGRYGYLYAGGSFVDAKNARNVGGVIRVLNTEGGAGLMRHYLGPDSGGNGQLITAGLQYDFSFARFMFPDTFTGMSQDIVFSGFGHVASVSSDQDEFDGVLKFKYGAEATYSVLPWLAPSIRYDRVVPDNKDNFQTWASIAPRSSSGPATTPTIKSSCSTSSTSTAQGWSSTTINSSLYPTRPSNPTNTWCLLRLACGGEEHRDRSRARIRFQVQDEMKREAESENDSASSSFQCFVTARLART